MTPEAMRDAMRDAVDEQPIVMGDPAALARLEFLADSLMLILLAQWPNEQAEIQAKAVA